MAKSAKNFWDLPPLSAEDQQLRDAYILVGKPVELLPYTKEFDRLIEILGREDRPEVKYNVFQRLLLLRKRGRLPNVGFAPAELL